MKIDFFIIIDLIMGNVMILWLQWSFPQAFIVCSSFSKTLKRFPSEWGIVVECHSSRRPDNCNSSRESSIRSMKVSQVQWMLCVEVGWWRIVKPTIWTLVRTFYKQITIRNNLLFHQPTVIAPSRSCRCNYLMFWINWMTLRLLCDGF